MNLKAAARMSLRGVATPRDRARVFAIFSWIPSAGKWCPEEDSIVKPMILKRNLFLFGKQNGGPFDGPRQYFMEWFKCWMSQQRTRNVIAIQSPCRNPRRS
ncbi:hypothetical protein GGC65_001172 [Sphingopyxis sp. OAS728]|nr:hypothetical protein [Sphingopyxis sp. OAS728]